MMRLRRAVRRHISGEWTRRAWPVVGSGTLVIVGVGALTPYVSTEAAALALVGFVVLALLEGFAFVDECGECGERVDVKVDRYCSVCGESLTAVPYRPADFDEESAGDDGRAAT